MQDVKINGVTYRDVYQIRVPKADGNGEAVYQDASDLVSPIDIAGIFAGTATEIDDINGEVDGVIGTRVLNNNDTLLSVILPAATHTTGETFRYCDNLRVVQLDSCDNVSSRCFSDCPRLEEVYLPLAEAVGSYGFYNCSSLVELSLPNCKTLYGAAFQNCSHLETLSIPEVTLLDGTDIFSGASSLLSVAFPKLTATASDYPFRGSYMTDLVFPVLTSFRSSMFRSSTHTESITAPLVNWIGANCFNGATALTKLVLANNAVATLENVSAFTSTPIASGTGYIYVPDDLVDSYKAANNWSTYEAQIKSIEELPS